MAKILVLLLRQRASGGKEGSVVAQVEELAVKTVVLLPRWRSWKVRGRWRGTRPISRL
jgi:hypothetical protein